jgi:hypothetical protein
MKQDNVSAGQTRELDNPQLICEWLLSHVHVGTLLMTTSRPAASVCTGTVALPAATTQPASEPVSST